MIKDKIKALEKEIKQINDELINLKNALCNHYHKLLKEGKDTRSEGLVWIIKEMLLLGVNIQMSKLPTFLDENLINYLFKFAIIDSELKKLNDKKSQLKLNFKLRKREKKTKKFKWANKMFKTTFDRFNAFTKLATQAVGIVKHPSRLNFEKLSSNKNLNIVSSKDFNNTGTASQSNRSRPRNESVQSINSFKISGFSRNNALEKYVEHQHDNDEKYTLKTVTDYLEKKGTIEKSLVEIMNNIEDIDEAEKKLRILLVSMKRTELERLFKEFITNDYTRRYKVDRQTVVSAIVGEDNTQQELQKMAREEKVIYINNYIDLHRKVKNLQNL